MARHAGADADRAERGDRAHRRPRNGRRRLHGQAVFLARVAGAYPLGAAARPHAPAEHAADRGGAADPLWRLELDTTARHLVDAAGTMVALSGAEYRLLRVFLDHPQRVLTRDQLLNLTQGRDADLFDRSIDLLVSRLRQRLLDDAREPRYIKTLRSEGYIFSAAVEVREAGA